MKCNVLQRLTVVLGLLGAVSAHGQSLFERRPQQPAPPPTHQTPATQPGTPAAPAQPPAQNAPAAKHGGPVRMDEVSLFAVTPPPAKQWAKHDLVEVIVNRSSVEKFEQSLDTKKDYDLMAELRRFPSIRHLLEAQLREGDSSGLPVGVDVGAGNKFKGEGEFERKDQITTRLSAVVVDVKPNGTLVLEARDSQQSGKEIKTMVLSGVCRSEDITKSNTIQSSQLANFVLKIEHEGEVKKAGEKGLIPRVLEAIFNF